MEHSTQVGSRIRARREVAGLRQSDLARKVGISGSYLNLIEHNRRRIGGKLLIQIAKSLAVEPAQLSDGADARLLAALRAAQAAVQGADPELDRPELDQIEDFVGRFPGWARLVAQTYARTEELHQKVQGLRDRIAHDPALAASVHEVLSTAASIRSTASILTETEELGAEWLRRFHKNIHEDSKRLADSSRALAGFLEQDPTTEATLGQSLQDDVDAFVTRHQFHFQDLESGGVDLAAFLDQTGLSASAKIAAFAMLQDYQRDAQILPHDVLNKELSITGQIDPVALAQHLDCSVGVVLRRLASQPNLNAGFVSCDASGALVIRKAVPGFDMPQHGPACALWPLFRALTQPGQVVRQRVEQIGRNRASFTCFAYAEPLGPTTYNMPPLVSALMLLVPDQDPAPTDLSLGASCQICPKADCPGRRVPSVLSGAQDL
ncbi:MAG: helix-turn-helix domain-containing protein [Paracoccaceae bacterium]